MATERPHLEVGQEWAYRGSAKGPLARVPDTKFGNQKPARAKVYLVEDQFEGREEWVPRAWLKVRWDQVGHWQAPEGQVRGRDGGLLVVWTVRPSSGQPARF